MGNSCGCSEIDLQLARPDVSLPSSKTLNPILGLRVLQVGKGTADKGSGRGTSSGVVGIPADAAEPEEEAGEVGLAVESDADSLVGSAADSSAGSEHSTAAPAPAPATKGGGRGRGKGRTTCAEPERGPDAHASYGKPPARVGKIS